MLWLPGWSIHGFASLEVRIPRGPRGLGTCFARCERQGAKLLEDHAQAAGAVNHIIAPIVARELLQDDLTCRCIGPMCDDGRDPS